MFFEKRLNILAIAARANMPISITHFNGNRSSRELQAEEECQWAGSVNLRFNIK